MQSKAATVEQYLAELPPDRRQAIEAVRQVILKNLDKDYAEGMSYGMIAWCVPHSVYPAGYHCNPKQPLPFAALASQKNYMSLYLMPVYGEGTDDESWFRREWAKTGKKLDMGKCCIRFKRVEDLALDVIGEAIRRVPTRRWIEFYERTLLRTSKQAGARLAARKAASKPAARPAKKAAKRNATKKSTTKRR